MHSKNITFNNTTEATTQVLFHQFQSFVTTVLKKIRSYREAAEMKKSQEWFVKKQNQDRKHRVQLGTLSDLPLEKKLQMGCYHWMD